MTAEDIHNALRSHYNKSGWLYIRELRTGTGYGSCQDQYIDGWAISEWKVKTISNLIRAFEIKVNKSDFDCELKNPDKRWLAYTVSHEFYFVSPVGLIDGRTLSKDDGLIEIDNYGLVSIKKRPRQRAITFPRWSFVASIIRNIGDCK
ncbi:MAG: hypothetical protein PHD43_24370 [Methylococcales bacterium]|nr:hypothetical protein [Methylococcales bacterium]